MDKDTEIATGFTVGCYWRIRDKLFPETPDTEEWLEVLEAFERRIRQRFLNPIELLQSHDFDGDSVYLPPESVPGFAIMTLECLLIDTIQSFKEGRGSEPDISPALSFKSFLRSARFSDFTSKDRESFLIVYVTHSSTMEKRAKIGRSASA